MKKLEVTLPQGMETMRADKALARFLPELPWQQVRRAFEKRDVKQNGKRVQASTPVSAGDTLHVYVEDAAPPLDIVFQDDDYVIVNKRQGMEVQGEGSVEAAYARMTGETISACHRLDVQTGGLVLLARNAPALVQAEEAFARHTLQKTYHAVVKGIPQPQEAVLHAFLLKDSQAAKVRVLDRSIPGTLPIETRYSVLQTDGDTALLVVDLITGRTHQIRAHLAHIGHPILGDDKYGDRAFNRAHGVRRQKLWAVRLVLWDGRIFEVEAGF